MSLIVTVVCFFVLIASKTSLAAEFQCKTWVECNVLYFPWPLLSPRVLLHRLVSASWVPSRFRYNRRRYVYMCNGHIVYVHSMIARTVGGIQISHKERERERDRPVGLRKVGALALTSRCCRCHEASILPVPLSPLPFSPSPLPRKAHWLAPAEFLWSRRTARNPQKLRKGLATFADRTLVSV